MNTTNNLGIVYESIYKPAMFNTAGTLKSGSYKSIIKQIRDTVRQQIGDDVIEKLRNKEHFNSVKMALLSTIGSSEIDERTKEKLVRLVNKSHNICSLYSIFDVNEQLY